jgi:hypothetical protein
MTRLLRLIVGLILLTWLGSIMLMGGLLALSTGLRGVGLHII